MIAIYDNTVSALFPRTASAERGYEIACRHGILLNLHIYCHSSFTDLTLSGKWAGVTTTKSVCVYIIVLYHIIVSRHWTCPAPLVSFSSKLCSTGNWSHYYYYYYYYLSIRPLKGPKCHKFSVGKGPALLKGHFESPLTFGIALQAAKNTEQQNSVTIPLNLAPSYMQMNLDLLGWRLIWLFMNANLAPYMCNFEKCILKGFV